MDKLSRNADDAGMKSIFNFFQRVRTIGSRERSLQSTMLSSARTTQRWLDKLPRLSEYEMHHTLVEGLERFNGDTRGDAIKRIKVLKVMEETGLPMQAGIVAEYVGTPDTNHLGRQTLWREAQLFWNQMATAYLQFLKLVLRGDDKVRLKSWSAEVILKNLRYVALAMRWDYYRGQRPGEMAWRRLHRVYRMAEMAGDVLSEIEVEGRVTSCAREYVLALLFDLANPHVFQPREVHTMAAILEGLDALPIPEIGLRRDRHSHMIDLSASLGAEKIEDRWAPGKRLRYLELQGVVGELEAKAARVKDIQTGLMCKQIARIIGRVGARRDSARKPTNGDVAVAVGIQAVIAAMRANPSDAANLERWQLRDESREGLGLVAPKAQEILLSQLLVASRQAGEKNWQLLAVRWVREEAGQNLVGAESLSKHPKLVEIGWQAGSGEMMRSIAIFLPLANASHGATSNLLLPAECFEHKRAVTLRDDEVVYRLSLTQVVESHEGWLRVGFDVQTREVASYQ